MATYVKDCLAKPRPQAFSMLYSEAAGSTASYNDNDDAYTIVRFGEMVHSAIRRFIVVEVKRGFVYAW